MSVLIAHTAIAKAPAPEADVVTAGALGVVSFERADGVPKVTSCGVAGSIPDMAPHHQPTCSLVPSESKV